MKGGEGGDGGKKKITERKENREAAKRSAQNSHSYTTAEQKRKHSSLQPFLLHYLSIHINF